MDFMTSPGVTSEHTDDVHGVGAFMDLVWDSDVKPAASGLQPHALHNLGVDAPPGTDVGGTTIPPSNERTRWYLFSGEVRVPDDPGTYTVWLEVNALNLIRPNVTLTDDVSDGFVIGYAANGDNLVGGSFTFDVEGE